MTATESSTRNAGCVVIAIAVVVTLIGARAAIVIVPAGDRAVVFSSIGAGTKPINLHEGMNFITPFVDHPVLYEVRTRTSVFTDNKGDTGDQTAPAISAKTSDAQAVFVELTVRYHIDPDKVYLLHVNVGPDYEEKIVKVNTNGEARKVIAIYKADEVFSRKRQELEDNVSAALRAIFEPNYLVLDEVLVRNVSFTPEYHKAIEQKQIALQRAEMKRYELDRERKEKERKIIEAQGQGDAINIRGHALAQYPSVVQYDYVHALPDRVPAYVVGGSAIVNLSDLMRSGQPAAQPQQPQGGR